MFVYKQPEVDRQKNPLENSLDKNVVTDHGKREPQELPVGLLTLLEHLGGDLQGRWSLGTSWYAGHINSRDHFLVVLEDGLVLGIPEGHWSLHVPADIQIMCSLTKDKRVIWS